MLRYRFAVSVCEEVPSAEGSYALIQSLKFGTVVRMHSYDLV